MAQPRVGILMGSDSDLPVMRKAAEMLDRFGVTYRMTVASAHRTPDRVHDFVKTAEKDGARVFIAGAGGAAHLAGVVASLTTRPVIGVPIGSKLAGFDSLLSMVQMPSGVPVATVAVEGAANAGLLAVQILSVWDEGLYKALQDHKKEMEKAVLEKAKHLEL